MGRMSKARNLAAPAGASNRRDAGASLCTYSHPSHAGLSHTSVNPGLHVIAEISEILFANVVYMHANLLL